MRHLVLALLLALILKVYVAEAYEIHGQSMMPTFHDYERVMVLKVFYEIHRGDIIAWIVAPAALAGLLASA